jgi:N-acetylneuraminate synthase
MGNTYNDVIEIAGRKIGIGYPTYFIADIAANHDGDLQRAKDLICLAAEAGADAVKFQHFAAKTIVSDYGFKALGGQQSHQASWKKSVYEVYQDASLNVDWTPVLKETCDRAGITFMTSPYSIELVDLVEPFVSAYKIGSGDITWHEITRYVARKGKPVLLATGAANLSEVRLAVDVVVRENPDIALLQCNTNYTASKENLKHIQLNVLTSYARLYPNMVLGLSDHTHGCVTVLGAVALGARVIEKHFTDDCSRAGPDHAFSMDPSSWREMVERTRELELSLGSSEKRVEKNEKETVVLQRRAIRAARPIAAGTFLKIEDVTVLRPCPDDGLPPYRLEEVLNKTVTRNIEEGEHIKWTDLK